MLILTVEAHGVELSIHDDGQRILTPWRLHNRPYESPLLEHIYAEQYRGVAVDVGANVGNHTLWFAGVCGLRVESFEPVHFEALYHNLILNNLTTSVRITAVALGASQDHAQHVGKGRLVCGGGPVQVYTLDSFHLRDVDFIKVDVEGMETEVLRGAEHTIRENTPVLYIEEWDDERHVALEELLHPWGYTMERRFDRRPMGTPVGKWTKHLTEMEL